MTLRRTGISTLSAALLMLVAAPASAQQVDSFTQLQLLVKPGDKVVVTDSTGNPTEGRIGTLSSSSLRLLVDGVARDLSEPEVLEIRQRRSDPLSNGAKIGAWVGAGFATLALIAACGSDSCGWGVGAAAVYLGLGAGVGVGIDAMIESDQTIYRNPGTPAARRLSVAPYFVGERKGLSLSVTF